MCAKFKLGDGGMDKWMLEDLPVYNIPELIPFIIFSCKVFESRSESSSLISRI